jgi:hypothetical protein
MVVRYLSFCLHGDCVQSDSPFFLDHSPSNLQRVDNDNQIRGGGRETSIARFSPTLSMIIIIVLFFKHAYYIIIKDCGCFEADFSNIFNR